MIIVPGSVNADLLFKVAQLPKPGETVLCPSYVMAPGGKGANQAAAAAKAGAADFIWFIAMLSTAVGFLNLFPIPVLDGGHLMFHLWEGVSGKPPSDRVMNLLVSVGLALVVSLMVFGLWNDLVC